MAMATALLILLLATPAAVLAVDYTVGDTSGWTQGVDYTTWVSGKTFSVGDVLVFVYGGNHKVDEVNKSGYDSCSTSNPIQSFSDGNTRINLTTSGVKYFTCPTAGHCSSGMKLAVTVTGTPNTPSGTPPTTPSGTPPSGSNTPSTNTSPPPPPPSNNGAGNTNNLMFVTISVALGVMFAFMG